VHVRGLGFVYVRSHLDLLRIVAGEGKGRRSHELLLAG
jgi:hypothetical protein